MRIFVYNCNTYIGKALVKELRKHDENGFNRIFGCQTAVGGAPATVKRLMTRDDPKKAMKMEEAIRSCSVVVLDLFNCTEKDLYFVLQALKVDPKSNPPRRSDIMDKDGNKKDTPITFILVSSAMVWADTQLENIVVPAAGEPAEGEAPPDGEGEPAPPVGPPSAFGERFFDQRVPTSGSRYEKWRDMENLVRACFSLEGSQVRAFIVGAGVLYGDGEETFTQLFKDAWLGSETHKIAAPGSNIIPTVHVRDMARLVRAVCYNAELSPETKPYFLAVDKIDEDAPAPTQAEIVKGIVGEVSGPRDIPLIEPPPPPKPAEDAEEGGAGAPAEDAAPDQGSAEALAEAMMLNLKMEPSSLMLEEGFEWHCRGGLLKNIRMVAEEFSTQRELRAMRVIIAGPPASGKNTLCKAVSDHFNIPLLQMRLEDLDATRAQLMSEVCRYRGYVLNAGLAGYNEVEQLFCRDYEIPTDPDAEDAEPPPPPADDDPDAEPAEPAPKKTERRLSEDGIVPTFAVMLQAPEGTCRARFTNAGKGDVLKFKVHMDQFTNRNLVDAQGNYADFFQDVAKIGVFNLPIAMKSEEDMFESTRIYMENGGRPFNYLKSADDYHDELLTKLREKEEVAAQMSEVAERQVSVAKDKNEADNKRHLERLRIIGAHESEKSQLEALPLREYLMRYMVPNLTEGLIEMCRVMPENPTDYLANYLEEHAARERTEN